MTKQLTRDTVTCAGAGEVSEAVVALHERAGIEGARRLDGLLPASGATWDRPQRASPPNR